MKLPDRLKVGIEIKMDSLQSLEDLNELMSSYETQLKKQYKTQLPS